MKSITGDLAEQFMSRDPNDNPERMLTEILLGIPKHKSTAIVTEGDSKFWDRLAAEKVPEGMIQEYNISAYEELD